MIILSGPTPCEQHRVTCRAMQQSLNFRQLFDTLAGSHGLRVWENAFDANPARSSVGFSERRFQLRNELNAHVIEQRVRLLTLFYHALHEQLAFEAGSMHVCMFQPCVFFRSSDCGSCVLGVSPSTFLFGCKETVESVVVVNAGLVVGLLYLDSCESQGS